jgi:hypothetical protein
MDMTSPNYRARLAWIGELTRDALLGSERRGLVLELRYALEAADRVREMVRMEQACCAFLTFDLQETLLFGQFLAWAAARGT